MERECFSKERKFNLTLLNSVLIKGRRIEATNGQLQLCNNLESESENAREIQICFYRWLSVSKATKEPFSRLPSRHTHRGFECFLGLLDGIVLRSLEDRFRARVANFPAIVLERGVHREKKSVQRGVFSVQCTVCIENRGKKFKSSFFLKWWWLFTERTRVCCNGFKLDGTHNESSAVTRR